MDLLDAVSLTIPCGLPRALITAALRGDIPDGLAGSRPSSLVASLLHLAHPGGDGEPTAAAVRRRAEALLAASARTGLEPLAWGDARYPPRLAAIYDPPPVLWVRGRPSVLTGASVAVVGSRAASAYGLEVAHRLSIDLARRGVAVVSGLARGVDSAAHAGALDGDGLTVAVLGSGADIVYPPEHGELARRIAEAGAVVSELPPGTGPRPRYFPLRNRIISGLSLAVVVIEAAHGSGSLITAMAALEQGRDVMAVPGSVLSERHRGSHALLRDGAKIVETVDDILEELPQAFGTPAGPAAQAGGPEDPILGVMALGESYDLDALAAAAGTAPAQLLPRLLELELSGTLRREAGGRFARIRRRQGPQD